MSLFLGRETDVITRGELIRLPEPKSSGRHYPIPHATLLAHVEQRMSELSLPIEKVELGVSHNAAKFFGILTTSKLGDYGALQIGLRNSHDKTFCASLAFGSSVMVCDNMCFDGEHVLRRRNTRFADRDLPYLVNSVMTNFSKFAGAIAAKHSTYRATQIEDDTARALLCRMAENGGLPYSGLKTALSEWHEPRHPEFLENGKSVWRCLQAATESVKGFAELDKRTIRISQVVDGHCKRIADPKLLPALAS